VGAGILVDHHAGQGHSLAFDAVFATFLGGFDHASALQGAFEPAVAALPFQFAGVFAMETLNKSTPMQAQTL
jgi:hypothetical protein